MPRGDERRIRRRVPIINRGCRECGDRVTFVRMKSDRDVGFKYYCRACAKLLLPHQTMRMRPPRPQRYTTPSSRPPSEMYTQNHNQIDVPEMVDEPEIPTIPQEPTIHGWIRSRERQMRENMEHHLNSAIFGTSEPNIMCLEDVVADNNSEVAEDVVGRATEDAEEGYNTWVAVNESVPIHESEVILTRPSDSWGISDDTPIDNVDDATWRNFENRWRDVRAEIEEYTETDNSFEGDDDENE